SDHPVLPVIWSTPKIRGLWEKASTTSLLRWQLTHRGPLTSNVAESGGFAHSEPGLPAPDLQLHVLPAPYQNQGLADPARRAMTVLVGLIDVASRGRIRLRSADPRHRPAIDPGYLSDERDGRALASGLKLAREFVTARPMAAICSSELAPGGHLHDGRRFPLEQRGRPRAQSPRRDRAAGGRRVGDAGRAAREHQRAHD